MEQGKNLITKRSITVFLVVLFLCSIILPTSVLAQEKQVTTAGNVGVQYQTHIQDIGWEADVGRGWKSNGELSGTVGESKRLESLIIKLIGAVPSGANILTEVHVQDKGNLGPFDMGKKAGTQGLGLRMERITLTLKNLPGYTLKYNVQVENLGWLRDENDDSTWFVSGEPAGTTGKSLRLESIKVKLVEVNEEYEAYLKTVAAAPESDYTTVSWAIYKNVLDANVVTETDTKTAITTATNNIIAAQKKLIRGGNLAAYRAALDAAKEDEYTPGTWTEYYYGVVLKNVVTQDSTQTEISTAVTNILAGQKKLQRKVDLTEYKETLAAVRVEDYTASSWSEYQNVLAANAMTEDNTQTEINAAIIKIDEAQKKMVRKFDFTAYDALIKSVKSIDYIAPSWAVYQAVVDNNLVTPDDTQTKIEAAIKTIEAAQKKLIKAADLTYYNAALNAVKKEDYTTVSWNAYQKEVQAIIVNKTSKPEVVEAAITKILEAQLKLVDKGNMTYYLAALAKAVKAENTSASWAIYQKVVDANMVYATDGQPAIDAATDKIEAAQKKLVKAGDLSKYTALLGAVSSAKWTSASWAIYQKVLDANVMTPDKGQFVIDAAVEKIKTAQTKLVEKGSIDTYQYTLGLVKEQDWTVSSWNIYKTVLAANIMTTDKSQTEINAAVDKILIAQTKLVRAGKLAEYITCITKLDGKEGEYLSSSWTAYQNVLKANIMTTESKQADIDAAILRIEAVQKNMVKAPLAELKDYYEAIADYADRKSEFTAQSWSDYQNLIAKNPVTKDTPKGTIQAVTAKILNAQLNVLVSAADLTPFLEAIKLYQEDKQANGEYANNATNWDTYANLVKSYASFDEANNWAWKSAGTKSTDITQATSANYVKNATDALNAAKKGFVFVDPIKNAYAAYDTAISLPGGHTDSFYTVTSLGLFNMQKDLNAIPVRIKAELPEIQVKTGNMVTAQGKLVPRATDAVVKLFEDEVNEYNDKFNNEMDADENYNYIWENCYYTETSWTPYETVKKIYVNNKDTMLKADDNTDDDYEAATTAIQAKKAGLKYTEKFMKSLLSEDKFSKDSITKGSTNMVTLAQSLINAGAYNGKFTVEIVAAPTLPNIGVDNAGVVKSDATTITITYLIKQNGLVAPDTNTCTQTINITL